jgi:hypothetical protein
MRTLSDIRTEGRNRALRVLGPAALALIAPAPAAAAEPAPGAPRDRAEELVSLFQSTCGQAFGDLAGMRKAARRAGMQEVPLPRTMPRGFYARRGDIGLLYQGASIPGVRVRMPVPQCHVERIEDYPERFDDAAARVRAAFALRLPELTANGEARFARWVWGTKGGPVRILTLSLQRLGGEPKLLLMMYPTANGGGEDEVDDPRPIGSARLALAAGTGDRRAAGAIRGGHPVSRALPQAGRS